MTSYIVQVALERDEDTWRAFIPSLESRGAATWGHTREEALRNIQEVAKMVLEEQAPLSHSVVVLQRRSSRAHWPDPELR